MYRSINTDIWQDNYILSLKIEEKIIFVYLILNEHISQIGVHKNTSSLLKYVNLHFGLEEKETEIILNKFDKDGKVIYDKDTKELFVSNWFKYNYKNPSWQQIKFIAKELFKIKSQMIKTLILFSLNEKLKKDKFEKLEYELDLLESELWR